MRSPDRPVQTSILAYILVGAVLLCITRYAPVLLTPPKDIQSHDIPLQSPNSSPTAKGHLRTLSRGPSDINDFRSFRPSFYIKFLALVAYLCVRVELSRQVVTKSECATRYPDFVCSLHTVVHQLADCCYTDLLTGGGGSDRLRTNSIEAASAKS